MKISQKTRNAVPGIIFLIALFIIFIFSPFLIHFLDSLFGHRDEGSIHFCLFLATIALALIAWFELNRSHKWTANEFLLFISNRWGTKEIVIARQILHDLFIDAYRDENKKSKPEYSQALSIISEKILEISRLGEFNGREFIYLLNLLDYLETLSYFYNRGDLELKDVENTCGNNAIFFFEVFKLYIENRQKHDKSSFLNFSLLYLDLKKSKLTAKSP